MAVAGLLALVIALGFVLTVFPPSIPVSVPEPFRAIREDRVQEAAGLPPVQEAYREASVEVRVSSGEELVFLVRSESGEPLSGAEVVLHEDSGSQHLGVSDSRGAVVSASEEFDVGDLVACSSPVHARQHLRLTREQLSERLVVFDLTPAAHLSGRVVLADGTPAGAGISVFALGSRQSLRAAQGTPADLANLLVDSSVQTRDDGSFEFRSLAPDRPYYLEAAGYGVSSRESVVARCVGWGGAEDVVVEVYAVHGALLAFQLEQAEHFRLPLGGLKHSSELLAAYSGGAAARLLRWTSPGSPGCTECVVHMYYSRSRSIPDPDVEYSASIPGYLPFSLEYRVGPPHDGTFPRYEVVLESSAEGWGRVTVELDVPQEGKEGGEELERPVSGALVLSPVRGGKPSTHVVDFGGSGDRRSIGSVPEGQYDWSFTGRFRSPVVKGRGPIDVVRDQEALLHLDISRRELSFLEIHVADMDGGDHDGAVLLRLADGDLLQRGRGKWVQSLVATDWPHVIGPLVPGAYSIEIVEPRPGGVAPEPPRAVSLTAGEVHSEWFVLE